MRYIKVPPPVELTVPVLQHKALPLVVLVRDMLGSMPGWRENESTAALYLDIADVLEETAIGDYAKLTDEQHEKLLAVMRAFEAAPLFAYAYMKLFRSVAGATKERDAPKEAAHDAAANGVQQPAPADA